jgi:tRNA(Ile)-lysidine synthase
VRRSERVKPSGGDWAAAAERLGSLLPKDRLHPEVLKAASGRRPWVVAHSGGADSTALLLLLWAHWPERRAGLQVLHFNHRLRGRAADGDEEFCRKIAKALGLRFRAGRWRRPPKAATEAESREARFAFLHSKMCAARSRVLWLGHHQDDIAESMLIRLARGGGTSSLASPRPVQRMPQGFRHLRPLLGLRRSEIVSNLAKAGVRWREDASNRGSDFLRNRLRHRVIPAWVKASAPRDPVLGASIARGLLEEDADALDSLAATLAPKGRGSRLDLDPVRQAPRAVRRRVLHAWLRKLSRSGILSRQGFEALLEAVEAGKSCRLSLGRDGFARIARGTLFFESGRR